MTMTLSSIIVRTYDKPCYYSLSKSVGPEKVRLARVEIENHHKVLVLVRNH